MAATNVAPPPLGIARRTGKRPPRGGLKRANPAVYAVAAVLIIAMLAPVAYIIIGGFRTNAEITSDPSGLPTQWQISNYLDVLTGDVFWRQVLNSTIAAVSTTVGVVGLGLMVSFAIARYHFKGKTALYSLYAAGLMFPMTVAITPL